MTNVPVQPQGVAACTVRCSVPCFSMCLAGAPTGPIALAAATTIVYVANLATS